jgi:tRNA threonylcarbamoyladenosine biosynthesis protein TsaE
MGAGKTTLIKEICLKLGVEENVSSPSFNIINEYKGKKDLIYHFDAYRLNNEDEACEIGVEDYLFSGSWCLIEWSEKIKNLLPSKTEMMKVTIKDLQETRIYTFK